MYENILSRFSRVKVLVIGDMIVDKYVIGSVERISPEAPIPIVNVSKIDHVAGGAANVACNIAALNGKAYVLGMTGNDQEREILIGKLQEHDVDTSGLIIVKNYQTIKKTRVVAHNQQLVRLDYEDTTINAEPDLLIKLCDILPKVDIVIVSDYAKGVVTENLMKTLKDSCKKEKKLILVDPKPAHMQFYKDVFLIKPNKKEIEQMTGIKISDDKNAQDAGEKFIKMINANILMTRGESGMTLVENSEDSAVTHLAAKAREVYDVSGAGDTVMSALALSLVSGASLKQSADIANTAAGISVSKFGTSTVSFAELESALKG